MRDYLEGLFIGIFGMISMLLYFTVVEWFIK
jgi:hypothetical protein